jgi:hypothetical protein
LRYPTDKQIDDLAAIHSRIDFYEIARKLKKLQHMDAEVAVIDGYPASTTGGSGPGISDPTGSAVAAITDPDRRPLADPLHQQRDRAVKAWYAIDENWRVLRHILESVGTRGGTDPDTPMCVGYRLIGVSKPADHYGDVTGRLATKVHYSTEVGKFVFDHRRMPTEEEMQNYARHGRWRVRAAS